MPTPELLEQRQRNWRQRLELRIHGPEDAESFVENLGLVTLYQVSSEVPSLLLAHVGQTQYKTEASWDSPGGEVYTWRWALGKKQAAFYSSIVGKKPTFVAWRLLPLVLALLMDRREPEEAYHEGQLSADAYRVYRALAEAKGPLETGELRDAAGFPTGKEQRAAYLKAVEELESHLWLEKSFVLDPEDLGMRHALVTSRYPEAHAAAMALDTTEALVALLSHHLRSSVYLDLKVLARGLRISETQLLVAASSLPGVRLEGKVLLSDG